MPALSPLARYNLRINNFSAVHPTRLTHRAGIEEPCEPYML